MKTCILFVSHKTDKHSINQFTKLKNDIHNINDITLYYCTLIKNNIPNSVTTNVIKYNNDIINMQDGSKNPFKILENNYNNINDYDYYYIIEYDVYFSGSWKYLIEKLNSESNADLLGAYIKKFDYSNNINEWMWFNKYTNNETNFDSNIKYLLKSCVSFMRISNAALKFIVNYNNSNIKNYIYELYLPTLLYNYNYSIQSLSSNENEDSLEFYYTDIIKPNNFYCGVEFTNTNDMDSRGKNLLYTCFKEETSKNKNKDDIEIISKYINHNIEHPEISILMPVYNCEKYIKDALNSCLNQNFNKDYEIVIVNDGSYDNTNDIIQSFTSDKIVYIEKEHSGIVDSLNYGIQHCNGKYIVRMDADDIMYNDRLSFQYNYMEENPECDILGCSFDYGVNKNNSKALIVGDLQRLNINCYKNGSVTAHPTTIFRKESLLSLPFIYENYFDKCEDYKLWITAILHGLRIDSTSKKVLFYRSLKKNTSDKYNTVIKRIITSFNKPVNSELTVVIPFKNEGCEIEKTVQNIRGTTKDNVNIILINDCSDDNYDYKWVADKYNCEYVEHKEQYGVAKSRDEGVKLSKTDYFVLLDGHMRFYDYAWDELILNYIKEKPHAILSSESTIIWKETHGFSKNEDGKNKFHTAGAYINIFESGHELTAKWCPKDMKGYADSTLLPTPALMGACYCSNKKWWNHIGGLNGLVLWGSDEPLISIKTWLAGGQILLMKDLYVGHVYRSKAPYPFINKKIQSNYIWLIKLLGQDKEEEWLNNLKNRITENGYKEALSVYNETLDEHNAYIEHFWKNVAIHDMQWFLNEINDPVVPDDKKKSK